MFTRKALFNFHRYVTMKDEFWLESIVHLLVRIVVNPVVNVSQLHLKNVFHLLIQTRLKNLTYVRHLGSFLIHYTATNLIIAHLSYERFHMCVLTTTCTILYHTFVKFIV